MTRPPYARGGHGSGCSDTELLLKSRRVVPARLLEEGFVFDYPGWPEAAADLKRRRRAALIG